MRCNDTLSYVTLGHMYSNGERVEVNQQKEVEFFKKVCNVNSFWGCFYLAHAYIVGDGVEQNSAKAIELFNKTCDLGDMSGCENYQIISG